MGDAGDRGRKDILDPPMLAHAAGARRALDVGCGEGRFCRMLAAKGTQATGIDPTRALLDRARALDPDGAYIEGRAEALPFDEGAFDLVVSYLTLIDIPDFRAGITEMARVCAPGGKLLIANLAPHCTALPRDRDEGSGWVREADGTRRYFAIDDYATHRSYWTSWAGIRIRNHHRPLAAYMQAFLQEGLTLTAFDEPAYAGPDPALAERYRRVPWFNLMVWTKPGAPEGKDKP